MQNSLVNDIFIQYKCKDYFKEIVEAPFGESGKIKQYYIKTSDSINYDEVPIELEPTIQYLNSIKLTSSSAMDIGERLTHKYGFLNYKPFITRRREAYDHSKELKSATGWDDYPILGEKNPIFKGEPIDTWFNFLGTIQFFSKSLEDHNFFENLDSSTKFFRTDEANELLKDINLRFDINTQKVSLSSNSFAASMILYLVSKKRHLKSCLECSNLYFAHRTDKIFCNPNCTKKHERRNKASNT